VAAVAEEVAEQELLLNGVNVVESGTPVLLHVQVDLLVRWRTHTSHSVSKNRNYKVEGVTRLEKQWQGQLSGILKGYTQQ
jgi:hypothetical protein